MAVVEALVVVEDRDREHLLRVGLADDVGVEFEAQLRGRDQLDRGERLLRGGFLHRGAAGGGRGLAVAGFLAIEEAAAGRDAGVADADAGGTGDQLAGLGGGLAAEGAALGAVPGHALRRGPP